MLPFKQLQERLMDMVKSTIKLRSLDRDKLRIVIKQNREIHEGLVKAMSAFPSPEMNRVKAKFFAAPAPVTKLDLSQIPAIMARKYTGKAARVEMARFLGALELANKLFAGILAEVEKRIETLLEDEEITIYNCRMSGIMILGTIRQSDMVMQYSMYLWDHIVKTVAHGNNVPPKYRALFLLDKMEEVITTVNQICAQEGHYSFLADVVNLRKKNADLVLYANGTSFLGMLDVRSFNQTMTGLVGDGLSMLNVFMWVGEMWDNWQHARYLRDKEFTEWMRTHVALLRLELMDKDPNSPEYQRLLKIIEAYDEKITEYDARINEYLKEDD